MGQIFSDEDAKNFVNAASEGNTVTVNKILDDGKDVNMQDDQGNSALGAASFAGKLDTVKLLVDKSANIEIKNKIGTTPLWLASGYGHTEVLDYLLSKNAKTNEPNLAGDTPLIAACSKGHTAVIQKLVEAGAAADSVNKNGDTALSVAVYANDFNTSKLIVEALKDELEKIVNFENVKEIGPLAVASSKGNVEIIDLLVQSGARINELDGEGNSPLAIASKNKQSAAISALLKVPDIDLELRNNAGVTALWIAAAEGFEEGVKLLIAAGARANTVDLQGTSAFQIAVKNSHFKTAELLH